MTPVLNSVMPYLWLTFIAALAMMLAFIISLPSAIQMCETKAEATTNAAGNAVLAGFSTALTGILLLLFIS